MNRKTTFSLLAIAALLGIIVYATEWSKRSIDPHRGASGVFALNLRGHEILSVRVLGDYWSSFTLSRMPDGSWRITDPSDEPTDFTSVNRLLRTLEMLPAIHTIDAPGDDTERYQQYGLWSPETQIVVQTAERQYRLAFGIKTTDLSGIYCAVEGHDAIHVVPVDAFRIVTSPLDAYRLPSADPDAPQFLSPDDFTTQERADPEMAAPVWSPQDMQSPQMMSPGMGAPEMGAQEMRSPDWAGPEMLSPDWSEPAPPSGQNEMVSPDWNNNSEPPRSGP